jgi:hypothetical protein
MSLSGHQSPVMGKDEWLTPPEILRPLGEFDLDPCSPEHPPWRIARVSYFGSGGLELEWFGRVWCNPPFGREAVKWLRKMAKHGNGIALIPARTETAMFYECVWGVADAVCFIKGRPHFHHVTGERASFNSGAPIVLVAYGAENAAVLDRSRLGFTVAAKAEPNPQGLRATPETTRPDDPNGAADLPQALGEGA